MNRSKILEEASRGKPDDSFDLIAKLWSGYLQHRPPKPELDEYDVAMMMLLMKSARLTLRPNDMKAAMDAAVYAACVGEHRKQQEET